MRGARAFLLPAAVVLGFDLLAKLVAIGHLTPAVVDLADLDARRRALAAMSPLPVLVGAWSARQPCRARPGTCPRQWLLPGALALRYVENEGAAWNSPRSAPSTPMRVALAGAAALTVVGSAGAARRWPSAAPVLGALAGGAAANLIDRLRRGYVVDYLELHAGSAVGPVVNLADVVITTSLFLLVSRALLGPWGRRGRGSLPDPN